MHTHRLAELLRDHCLDLALGVGVLLLITLAGFYLMRRLRDRAGGDENHPNQLMTKFREMHSRGDLDETEYRTIKTVLATEFQNELRGNGEKA